MDIIDQKAKELGQAINDTDEAAILHAAEMNMDNDPEAQALIRAFRERQQRIQEAEEDKIEISDEEWEEFNQLQEKMKQNKSLKAYFAAMQNFQKVLQRANTVINQVLRGEPCKPSDCASCMYECQ
jgi:cell fate (sporulation/competence/biofilm development) regulator YlbF (YheA/YmcA/DUF963 family)